MTARWLFCSIVFLWWCLAELAHLTNGTGILATKVHRIDPFRLPSWAFVRCLESKDNIYRNRPLVSSGCNFPRVTVTYPLSCERFAHFSFSKPIVLWFKLPTTLHTYLPISWYVLADFFMFLQALEGSCRLLRSLESYCGTYLVSYSGKQSL